MEEHSDQSQDSSPTESVTGRQERPPIPTRLGSFHIEALISSGGMGSVYRAFDESMKRQVALKVLHPSVGISSSGQHRFAREAWIAGQLEHPNIVKVHSRGEEAGVHFLAMELADGGSLADRLNQLKEAGSDKSNQSTTGRSEYIRKMLEQFIGLCEAVEHVHSKGFIHRDIKPHNILLSETDTQFKLTDFGIAHADDMTKITQAGDFIGTIRYMSPELLAAHRAGIDKRTDIYSLGVTLYEALTLQLPYDGDTEERYLSEILAGHAVPARRRNARIPADVETVLMKATDHDPGRRYQSALAMASDLKAILENRPITARRIGLVGRSYRLVKRHYVTVVVGLAIIGSVTAASVYYDHTRDISQDRKRTIEILQATIATGKSPFEVEPNWKHYWSILAKAVEQGSDDSLALWFHRACQPRLPAQGEIEQKIALFSKSVQLFPEGTNQERRVFGLVTRISERLDSQEFRPKVTSWSYYSLSRMVGTFAYVKKIGQDTLEASAVGLHTISLRVISEHYRDVILYKDDGEESLPLPVSSSIIARGDYSVVTKDLSSGEVIEPFLVDTSYSQFTIVRM